MNELFNMFEKSMNRAEAAVGVDQVFIALLLALLLTLAITEVYKISKNGTSYTSSYLTTMILVSVSTAMIMMIIGSNIARAFSLVGALSIIRFRTPVKNAKDTAYIFVAMIIGMACGTGFYAHAIAFAIVISIILLVFHLTSYGRDDDVRMLVQVELGENSDEKELNTHIKRQFKDAHLINQLYSTERKKRVFFYSVLKPKMHERMLTQQIETLETKFPNINVNISLRPTSVTSA